MATIQYISITAPVTMVEVVIGVTLKREEMILAPGVHHRPRAEEL